jgi:hypothetical protein
MLSLRIPPCSQHAEITLLHELIADFEPYATVEADDAQVKALHPIPARLAKELSEWYSYRTATLNRLRTGTKVVDVTFDHEKQVRPQASTQDDTATELTWLYHAQTLLRFLGWCKTVHGIEQPTMAVLQSTEVGKTVEAYAQWLESRKLQWSSVTNYLSAVMSSFRPPKTRASC